MAGFQWPMLTRLYIEALLVDEDLADAAWELWEKDVIGDQLILTAWMLIVNCSGETVIS